MSTLEQIASPVAADMERYQRLLRQVLANDQAPLATMIDHVLASQGKRIRPVITLLVASAYNGGQPLGEKSYLSAAMVEMIHVASLIHDDVIDDSPLRRGKPSALALWQSRNAVLLGDYILSRALSAGHRAGYHDVVTHIASSVDLLCEGELIQSHKTKTLDLTRGEYFDIIRKKTAVLLGACSGAGAISVDAPAQAVEEMNRFGLLLGMAFQIGDDILDFSASEQIGKPRLSDLREHKITLPLLSVFESSDHAERERLLELLRTSVEKPENIDTLSEVIVARGGLETAARAMDGYLAEARAILAALPEGPCRQSLELLCRYIAERET